MAATLEDRTVLPPDEPGRDALREALAHMPSLRAAFAGSGSRKRKVGGRPALVDIDGTEAPLPPGVYEILLQIMEEMAQGRAVIVKTTDPILTTGQAADILNVSRVTVVKLLDEGVIPSFKRGQHRRVNLKDVLDYDARVTREREAVLGEMAYEAAHSGLDDETDALFTED